jgi:hypothetical protein
VSRSRTVRRAALLAALAASAAACRRGGGAPVAAVPAPAAGTLRCTPDRVGPADTITLTMGVPHGRELSVESPAGEFFMLVLAEPRPDDGPMLMPAERFRAAAAVRLPVASLRAKPYVAGRDTAERVFARPGAYRFRVAEVLNTDDGTPVRQCTVRLDAARRGPAERGR